MKRPLLAGEPRGPEETREGTLLRMAAKRSAWTAGSGYFRALVRDLVDAFDVPCAMLTECQSRTGTVRVLAFWPEHRKEEATALGLTELVGAWRRTDKVMASSEIDAGSGGAFEELGVRSFLAVPLTSTAGALVGHVAVMDRQVRTWSEAEIAVLETIGARTADELERLRHREALGHLSHELRTPLNGILGYTQLLERDPKLDARQLEMISKVRKCGERLLEVIEAAGMDGGALEGPHADGGELSVGLVRRMMEQCQQGDVGAVSRALDEIERQGRHPNLIAELRAHERSLDMEAIRERLGRAMRAES